ncbi:hypothetical protein IJ00_16015 [Calothrix sp. 336/3]|nr:hypothetical protein IJ00_16015 [Calothrix sp. 336/3]
MIFSGVLWLKLSPAKVAQVVTPQVTASPTTDINALAAVPINNSPVTVNTEIFDTPKVATKDSPQKPPVTVGKQKTSYGHLQYAEANPNQMIIVSSYASGASQRYESLRPEAALSLMKMIYAAREKGVWIIPVSGYRTIAQQQKLFQQQTQRKGSAKEAAKISAPAGYSEHHTGFAVDLADGKSPRLDLAFEFEKTDTYLWLKKHAQEFGFELSFPRNNPQGVSFEPWHWRYVGSPNAGSVFANARR